MTTEREFCDESPPPVYPDGGHPARGLDIVAALSLLSILIGFAMAGYERIKTCLLTILPR
jgi:hypothetical protein